jgi:hypothetical protein
VIRKTGFWSGFVTPYQKEQAESLAVVMQYLKRLSGVENTDLHALIADYLSFRKAVGTFFSEQFSVVCNRKCFQNRMSACCSRDGIITFFADVVINALESDTAAIERLSAALHRPHRGAKCVYLAENGCLWRIKPIVCEMFLCDSAKETVFADKPTERRQWEVFEEKKKQYTWPDRTILFDTLEKVFMDAGFNTALMYLHNSPGLLRVKRRAAEKQNH